MWTYRCNLRQPICNFLWRVEVGEALGQIDSPIAIADAGNAPDDGIRETRCSSG